MENKPKRRARYRFSFHKIKRRSVGPLFAEDTDTAYDSAPELDSNPALDNEFSVETAEHPNYPSETPPHQKLQLQEDPGALKMLV